MLKVFLCSTFEDLEAHRAAVHEALRMSDDVKVLAMENWTAHPDQPKDVCLQKVEKADLVVALVGHLHGYIPQGDAHSITQSEYERAEQLGTPILAFVAPEDFAVPMSLVKRDSDPEAQERFRARVLASKTVDLKWTTPERLASRVVGAVSEHHRTVQSSRPPRPAEINNETQDLKRYLSRLVEKYRWLRLQDLREAGSLQIELEKVYIALKTEPESEYELQQSAGLHEVEVLEDARDNSTDVINTINLEELEARNIRRTFRTVREEARRTKVTEVHTFGDAFRQHRRIVILGGPGSGKTTLGRWLALQLAKALALELDADTQAHVTVLRSQVDPDVRSESDEPVDLGPTRLPIILRLSHFARELAALDRDLKPAISLIDYLGRDPDSEELRDGMTTDARNKLFRAHLASENAVVILDGLDELSESNRRTVTSKIQSFITDYTPESESDSENELPYEVGGNQIIVTSRYVGYKYHPVRANCAHFGVQQMQRPAVERFVHAWSAAVNEILAAPGLAGVDADQLLLEIYSPDKPRLRELATNPLLITILATVYWRDGKLPDQRAGIYDRVIESLVEVWLKRDECKRLTREQLMAALEPLAADLQENASMNGLVSLARIGTIIEGPLAHVTGIDDPTDRRFREQLDGLLGTIRRQVGLLAEQSAGNYAFLHRTFQEFLAARHLLADRAIAPQRIGEKLDDPLWREPLLLALGFVMIHWERDAQVGLLTKVLEIDEPEALIPRATFLLTDALLEIHQVPTEVVEQIVTRLLTSYSIGMEQIQARGLRERIERTFIRLRDGPQTDVVVHLLAEAIRHPDEERDLTFAVADVVRHIGWYSDEIIDSLLLAVGRDRGDFGWPICQALIKALNRKPNQPCWIDTAPPQTLARIESAHLPMRKLLKGRPDLVGLVRNDPDWLALLLAFYGGLDQSLSIEEYQRHQRQRIEAAKSAASSAPSEAEAFAPPVVPRVDFSPQFIFWDLQDIGLSRIVQRHLSQQRPARELADTFRRRWEQGSEMGAVEALVGLAALGEDVLPRLRESLTTPDRQAVAQLTIERFSRLRFLLSVPLTQTSEVALRTIPDRIPEDHQLDLLRIVLNAHIACGGRALKVGTAWPDFNFIATTSPDLRASLDAEYWAYLFSGAAGDWRGEDILPSVLGALASGPSDRLLHAWTQVPYAVNHTAQHHLEWPQRILAPGPGSPAEMYLAMLDAIESVPAEYHSVAGYVLAQCRSVVDANPFLLQETMAMCKWHGEAFSRGYLMNRAAIWDKTSEYQARLDRWLTIFATTQGRELRPDTMFDDGDVVEHVTVAFKSYLQFRASGFLRDSLSYGSQAPASDLATLIDGIPDPGDRVRAVEFILMGSSELDSTSEILPDLLITATSVLPEISDPETRARTFGRLAVFIPGRTENLLVGAIEALGAIPDPARKAATIQEVGAVWGRAPGMAAELEAVAETIADPWERDKALGRTSRLVHERRALGPVVPLAWRLDPSVDTDGRVFRKGGATGTLAWSLLYLFGAAEEVGQLGTGHSSSDALWDGLLDDPSEAVAGLIEAGLEEGLPVSMRSASILDRVLQEGQADELEPLWPYLGRPVPGALATISRWPSRLRRASQWSALVQAEAGRLNPDIVGSVIGLLSDSTDLLRLRASLALHGPTAHTENPSRRWRVSRVGAETLNVLAQEAKRPSNSQATLTAIAWTRHDVHHDSPQDVRTWIRQACEGGRHSPAAWLLAGMESAEDDVVAVLLSELPSAPPNVQHIILKALARLSHCSGKASLLPSHTHQVVARVPEEVRARLSILPKGTESLLYAVRDAVKETQSAHAWRHALMLMETSSEWLDEKSLESVKSCMDRLKAIGGQHYVNTGGVRSGDINFDAWKGSYWKNTDKVASLIAQDDRIHMAMIDLLSEIDSVDRYVNFSSHLLTATEAVARMSPATFARLAAPEDWEPVLTDWAQNRNHWSERLAAVRLLGRLRRVTPRVAEALGAAMEDNPFTQHAAYAAVCEFRHVEGDVFHDVLLMLDNSSAATSVAASRLLVSATKAGLDVGNRRQILKSLQNIIKKSSANRPVFLTEVSVTSGASFPKFHGTLDEFIYQSIFDISEI